MHSSTRLLIPIALALAVASLSARAAVLETDYPMHDGGVLAERVAVESAAAAVSTGAALELLHSESAPLDHSAQQGMSPTRDAFLRDEQLIAAQPILDPRYFQ